MSAAASTNAGAYAQAPALQAQRVSASLGGVAVLREVMAHTKQQMVDQAVVAQAELLLVVLLV